MQDCLFCKIISREIKTDFVFETPEMVVIYDINPQAPTHLLLLPKKHIATIDETDSRDEQLLGRMILTAKNIAKTKHISDDGYRLIFNVNAAGGQTVHHIHLHLLGGRQMHWPPG